MLLCEVSYKWFYPSLRAFVCFLFFTHVWGGDTAGIERREQIADLIPESSDLRSRV